MGKKEQCAGPRARAISLCWVFFDVGGRRLARGRPPDGGLALAVFHMVPRVPAASNLFVHPPADLRKVLLPPSRGRLYCYAYVVAQNAQIGHVM